MVHRAGSEIRRRAAAMSKSSMLALAALLAGVLAASASSAQKSDRSGKEVVDSTCAGCHRTGEKGAPKIGDQKAWAKLSARSLSDLSESALKGIRNMPAHGGNPSLSDIEIERAITYMVNQSGGKWIEPASGVTPAAERKGEQVVKAQCSKCHQSGLNGAPRIGDRDAWVQRLKGGLDKLVRSAINGHGPMPARGGLADLTDAEIRGAILYMFNPAPAAAKGPAAAAPAASDRNRHVVDGTEVYLGVMSAESIRARPKGSSESTMHGGIPSGRNWYHVNVSLFDAKTRAPITDAQVEASVREPVSGGDTKKLEMVTLEGTRSYGHYFRMSGKNPYTIALRITRPGVSRPLETQFEFKP